MARALGSKSSVSIPLATLVAKLPANQIVSVSKGWLVAVQKANSINFDLPETAEGSDEAATAPASTAARPKVEID
jgi:hypothetical protein